MKKLLYIAPVYINVNKPDGVAKKVMSHHRVFAKYYESDMVSYSEKGVQLINGAGEVTTSPYGNKHRRYELFSYIEDLFSKKAYDYVYIRYPKSDPKFLELVKFIKSFKSKIVVEIPTYPYNGKIWGALKTILIAGGDAICRTQLKKYVDRIVTYSDDDNIFGIPTIRTINGIEFDKIKPHYCIDTHANSIEMIAVAIIWSCHGYDRIIKGLNNYYSNGGAEKIVFHIVGTGPAVAEYDKLIKEYHLQEHVVLHGFKTGKDLDSIYDKAQIAVNSIAIHRMKLKKESTLKTKEYAAKGLPIISSYDVDAFDQEGNNKYVMLVPPDETPIDIEKIIKFYHKIYDSKNSLDITNDIRNSAQKVCDMEITLRKVIDFYNL